MASPWLPATTIREPCFASGRWKLGEVEPLFRVTKPLSQVCLNLPNSTDLGGEGEHQGKREGRRTGRREGGGIRKEGRIRGNWPEQAEQPEATPGLEYPRGLSQRDDLACVYVLAITCLKVTQLHLCAFD